MSYVYPLSATAKGRVESARLANEIRDSAIATRLSDVRVGAGQVELWFDDGGELSAGDKTLLDEIVARHQPFSTAEDKPIVLPNIFADDVDLYFPGVGDTASNIGDGQPFQLSSDVAGDTTITWSFRDWLYLAGGVMTFRNGELGDTITFTVNAPASGVTPNPGAGNVNLVPTGLGFNAIIPAAGDGSHDLTTPIPIPTDVGGAKYWDWSRPDTGLGSVSAVPTGNGSYSLFDVAMPLVTWLRAMPLLGSGMLDYKLPAIRPKRILPHWEFQATLTNGGHAGLEVVWVMFGARKVTQ